MSNVAVFEAINMNREQLLEESGRMLPILKEINDKEDESWQQEYYLQYTKEQENAQGNMLSQFALEWCAPIVFSFIIFSLVINATDMGFLSFVVLLVLFVLLRKICKSFTGRINGEAAEEAVTAVVVREITNLRTEIDELRRENMGWMTRIFPEDMLFYDAISYIHQALRMGMADNFKEAINNYMQHVHQKRMEFEVARGANAAERAAIAAEQTAYEVRQLRFEEAMRFFFSG